ncbi:MAG: TRAP transporter small permease [Thermoleophilia bacterium]|nr:TRAP transporter small permease [Thermoleophilia bacterium]
MKRFLLRIDSVVAKVSDWGLLISGILIMLMGILTTYGVGRRYVFDDPEPYSYELSVIFLVTCILISIPAIQKDRRHLRVDFLINHMSPKWQGIMTDVFTALLAMVFLSVVIWKSWGIFMSAFQSGETSQSAWQEPLWPMKLLVPISMGWLFLTLVSQLVHGIINVVKGTVREDNRIQL